MLSRLFIRNFALIEELDIDFHEGFSVVTGETGAGKSIILGAIGLLLGQRADMKAIKTGADKCVVEAHFQLAGYDDIATFFSNNDLEADLSDTIVRRELTASGKSRAFINDTPVALSTLKDLGERLIDVHSQHQNLLLGKHDFQLNVVDVMADNNDMLKNYQKTYHDYHDKMKMLEEKRAQLDADRQKADFMKFQFDELTNANLEAGEQEELESREEMMTHSEDIKNALYEAENALNDDNCGIVMQLRNATSSLRNIQDVFADASEMADRLESCHVELKDLASDISRKMNQIDFDPAELNAIENRLDTLNSLEKKYRVQTVEELITIKDETAEKLSDIDGGDELLQSLEHEVQELLLQCRNMGKTLSSRRQKAAKAIEEQMEKRLEALGMPNARFKVTLEADTENGMPTLTGFDRLTLMFTANTSSALQPIAQVASGGEIARVMLALKTMISGKVKLPTIIFDEIDTGVSGKIAEQMAVIMAEMGSSNRQVISITHLPQIAAKGTNHYKVYKEDNKQGTASHMIKLTQDERIAEIAQMLSGSNVTAAAYQNAKELLRL